MKALHVSASDGGGGAARAAYRIHQAISRLSDSSWSSEMLVARRMSEDMATIQHLEGNRFLRSAVDITRRVLDQEALASRTPNGVFRSPARLPTAISRRIIELCPDVVVLHWLGSRMMSVRQIGHLASHSRPLAWVLHDSWTFCGAEHYPHDEADRRFVDGYLRSNRLEGERGLDLNRRVWERKRRLWTRPIHLIAPSAWMAEQASRSAIAADWPVTVIPNPLDAAWWGGLQRSDARRRLEIAPDAPVLIYGALGGDKDTRKGADLLFAALENVGTTHGIAPSRPLEVLTFGGRPGTRRVGQHTVRSVGALDDEGLRLHYSAADVMIVPSRMESFGQTATEAITCGTPVVAFRTGGLTDIVDDGVNGRLAEPFSPTSLARAIEWVLEWPERHRRLSAAARSTSSRWEPDRIAKRYVALFDRMLEDRASENQ